ncbi:hypothetical protein D3C81_1324870 [compost metagenome]
MRHIDQEGKSLPVDVLDDVFLGHVIAPGDQEQLCISHRYVNLVAGHLLNFTDLRQLILCRLSQLLDIITGR